MQKPFSEPLKHLSAEQVQRQVREHLEEARLEMLRFFAFHHPSSSKDG